MTKSQFSIIWDLIITREHILEKRKKKSPSLTLTLRSNRKFIKQENQKNKNKIYLLEFNTILLNRI